MILRGLGRSDTATYQALDRIATWRDGLAREQRYAFDKGGNMIRFTDRHLFRWRP